MTERLTTATGEKACFRNPYLVRFSSHSPLTQSHRPTALTCFEGPFGEVLRSTGPVAKVNPFRFSTKFQDDETDLLYYGYRYYDASTGRWLSRDPIEELGGCNIYAFARNGALTYVDTDGRGLFSEAMSFAQGVIANAAFVKDWVCNTGSTNRFYKDGDSLAEAFKKSHGIQKALEEYKKAGCPDTFEFAGYATLQGYKDCFLDWGCLNYAEFQVGGFGRLSIDKVNSDTIRLHVENDASLGSFIGQPTAASFYNAGARKAEGPINSGIDWLNGYLPDPVPRIPVVDIPTWPAWPDHTREELPLCGNIHQVFDFTMPNPCCK